MSRAEYPVGRSKGVLIPNNDKLTAVGPPPDV